MTNLHNQITTKERFLVLLETLLKHHRLDIKECERKIVAKCKHTGNTLVFVFKLDTGLYDVKHWS